VIRAAWIAAILIIAGCVVNPNRPAEFVSGEGPNYPAQAQEAKIEGWVLVEYSIDKEGHVVAPHVVEAQPPGVFDQAALDAVAQWRYTPRYVNGVPAEATGVHSKVTFKLGEAEDYADY
jgi:TonB family protein